LFSAPAKVNSDPTGDGFDQFQPQIAITRSGQVDISYFDRRNDPSNFFIDTYLSRSNDGGRALERHSRHPGDVGPEDQSTHRWRGQRFLR